MADDTARSPSKIDSPDESDDESVDDKEEVLLLDSDSDDDSDSERKPPPEVEREPRQVPAIDPRIDQSLSEIVQQGQKNVKRYENKNSAKFVTGVDVTSKEARKKRENRAKRFGTEKDKKSAEEEEDISSVLLAPGSKIGGHLVRLEALHMTGVDDMSTQDIFGYFQSYDPSSIEWINDSSCNIVWLDPHSAARALLGMSKPREGYFKLGLKNLAQSRHLVLDSDPLPLPAHNPELSQVEPEGEAEAEQEQEPEGDQEAEPMEEGGDDDEDTLDLVSDRETGEKVRPGPQRIIPTSTASTTTSHSNFGSREEGMEGIQLADDDLGPVDIAREEALRIGKPHPSADELVLRYATKDDVKERGAYKHSQYYIKYGNPNFRGMRGLISETMKKKIRQGKFIPGQARKRRYQEDSDGEEREEEREEWPRKRRVPERMERRLGEREPFHRASHSPSPPPSHSPPSPHHHHHHHHADGDRGSSGEEEGADLEAELRHALREPPLGDGGGGGDRGRAMSRRMYADDIEDEIKKIRQTEPTSHPMSQPIMMMDARERLHQHQQQGRGDRERERPSIKSRLGGGGVGLGIHSVTPAPSMENLKVILDVNDRVAGGSGWSSESGESDDGGETLVVPHDYEDDVDDDDDDDHHHQHLSMNSMAGIGSDLRARLNRRQPDLSAQRPGYRTNDTRPAFLHNLPSLQIEIREDM